MAEIEDYDVVDYWSEVKLDIVKKYLAAYTTIMNSRTKPSFSYVYIDGFSGPGVCISKASGDYIPGSPLNALNTEPPFRHYYFIDMDGGRAASLRQLSEGMENVEVFEGDCNEILLGRVFPQVKYKDYRRGVCLLDPYKMDARWDLVESAGKMQSLELFLNFPNMVINRTVLLKDPSRITEANVEKMKAFWGDESWRDLFYRERLTLFDIEEEKGASNVEVVNAYRERLRRVAGFEYVSEGMPMINRKNSVVYYLLFASHKPVAEKIVREIFDKYRGRGAV